MYTVEIGMRQLGLDRGHELHVVLTRQRECDLPRADRGAGHARRERVAGSDGDLAPRAEHALDVHGRHDIGEAGREIGVVDVGVQRQPKQLRELMVTSLATALYLVARFSQ